MPMLLRRPLGFLVACAMVLSGVVAATTPRGRPDLRRFDPAALGMAEAELWRAYYERRHAALATGLVLLNRTQYGFSVWDSLRSGVAAMLAARRFQPSRSRAEAAAAMPPLVDHFAVVRRATHARFDPAEAARRELEWWQARRENVPAQGYAPLIAAATAALYEVDPARLAGYARLRAAAMDLRDRRGDTITEADWALIADRLAEAYRALRAAVSQAEDGQWVLGRHPALVADSATGSDAPSPGAPARPLKMAAAGG
jgi:hypothetical protein